MDWTIIFRILQGVALLLGIFFVAYFRTSEIFKGFVAQLIADAEAEYRDIEKAGAQKFTWVIGRILALIPPPLKPFFSETKIREFVQGVFNEIQKYAAIQCDNIVLKLQKRYNEGKKKAD